MELIEHKVWHLLMADASQQDGLNKGKPGATKLRDARDKREAELLALVVRNEHLGSCRYRVAGMIGCLVGDSVDATRTGALPDECVIACLIDRALRRWTKNAGEG